MADTNTPAPPCPTCGGDMWDNREENARRVAAGQVARPDFKCKATICGKVIWPPRDPDAPRPPAAPPKGTADDPSCPKCSGRMWDNRVGKKNPKAPDFKCRNRSCDGVIWPPRDGEGPNATTGRATTGPDEEFPDFPGANNPFPGHDDLGEGPSGDAADY